MRRRRRLALLVGGLLIVVAPAGAQDEALMRGLDLEQQGKLVQAAAAYREAITPQSAVPAVLGLERCLMALGLGDSLLPVLDSLIAARPRDAVFRNAKLRTLISLDRLATARGAFDAWTRELPRDPAPFREYSRLLLQNGRIPEADSVLQRAQRGTGGGRDFAIEVAQLRAAMGLWAPSAQSWRVAYGLAPYVEQAAVYALAPTPLTSRELVRRALAAPPVEVGARRILAALEATWGSPRAGWVVLQDLPPDSASASAWLDFAQRAESSESWLVARDALVAALDWRPSVDLTVRAATAALSGGDATGALALLGRVPVTRDSAATAKRVVPLQVRALTTMGRATEAERLMAAYAPWMSAEARADLSHAIAWGWIRAGDVGRARNALVVAGTDADSSVASGWIALYEGDLRLARAVLRRANDPAADAVTALALLSRTRVDSAPTVGAAFLALARGDSLRAATTFERAATEVADAAPLLLMAASQLHAARRSDERAIALWQRIVDGYAQAPEAAEADLEWARALRRRGDAAAAIPRLEHLILTYPESALVPQARRELDLARSAVPGTPEE
jgi:tetratricopeptide (TPR) repeat protein